MVEGQEQPQTRASSPAFGHDEWAELVQRLATRRASFDRYTVHGEVGHGGMGRVLHVRDEDLHRDLAMKVMKQDGSGLGIDPSTPTMMRARFVEEAQVAGQLDHPGIVPVHDVGLDADGQFYFTMKLVRGRTLEKVIGLAQEGGEGWSLTRVLNTLLRVCEAMSYAHERGVIHRDLKPANVMIGNHGEVYVMDWGLARLLDRPEPTGMPRDEAHSAVRSARSSGGSSAGSSLFLTQNDQIVGTPAFMSPEQAEGANATLTAQTDIYSAGAILYMALTGTAPYCKPRQRVDNRAVWVALQAGPPTSVASLAPAVAPELVSICEKAMARALDERYATIAELAEDLRAYLEMRVVHAHRTGPIVEFTKWVRRNKKTAGGLLLITAVVCAAGFTVAASERARAREAELRADVGESTSLLGGVEDLGPVHPSSLGSYQDWLARVRRLVGTLPERTRQLQERAKQAASVSERAPSSQESGDIRSAHDMISDMERAVAQAQAAPATPEEPERDESRRSLIELLPQEIDWRTKKLAAMEAALDHDPVVRFPDRKQQSEANEYHTLLHNLHGLERLLPRIQGEADRATELKATTVDREQAAWDGAIASIADRTQCPLYEGLSITAQIGLVPLRRDSRSGLWEFWHVLTGVRPVPRPDGEWNIDADTGLVLVLVPGGAFRMGAQGSDPAGESFDPSAEAREKLRTARLDPYFISKYEMTQGQWQALTDDQPSDAIPGKKFRSTPRTSRSNPVESVNWVTCERVLARVGLELPTEMQWERAARAGTDAPYVTSTVFEDIYKTVNFYDRTAGRRAPKGQPDLDDGFVNHLRVDAFGPNPFGLYNVLGNVSEWCLDWHADKDDEPTIHEGNGLLLVSVSSGRKSIRGGSCQGEPLTLRVSARSSAPTTERFNSVGVRPARALDP